MYRVSTAPSQWTKQHWLISLALMIGGAVVALGSTWVLNLPFAKVGFGMFQAAWGWSYF